MTISKEELERGRELAEKVTKGYWKINPKSSTTVQSENDETIASCGNTNVIKHEELIANTSHIAHHSGQMMLEIYDYIAHLEAEKETWGNEFTAVIILKDKITKLEAKLKIAMGVLSDMACCCQTLELSDAGVEYFICDKHRSLTAIAALNKVDGSEK